MSEQGKKTMTAASSGSDSAERREATWLSRLKAALGLSSDVSFRESLETALEQPARAASAFSPEERLMLLNILGFRELRVEDVMVPRADIIACEETVTLGELLRVFRSAGHSRIPVYRETLDDPKGMVHIKDLMSWITSRTRTARRKGANGQKSEGSINLGAVDLKKTLNQTKLVRRVLFVPPSMSAVDLLVQMQTTRIHLALVIDEFGGTDGLASIEDLVEEIVGDIEDEHDPANAPQIKPTEDGGFLADARFDIDEFRALTGQDFGVSEDDEDVDTLGGLVFSVLGRVPARGEVVTYPGGLEFEVLDADPRRIKKLKVYVLSPEEAKKRARPKGHAGDRAQGTGSGN